MAGFRRLSVDRSLLSVTIKISLSQVVSVRKLPWRFCPTAKQSVTVSTRGKIHKQTFFRIFEIAVSLTSTNCYPVLATGFENNRAQHYLEFVEVIVELLESLDQCCKARG